MESLFRWSKFVTESDLDEWENRLIMDDVAYTASKLVKRKQWQITSFVPTRREADDLRRLYGGGVTECKPDSWAPKEVTGETALRIRDQLIVSESRDPQVLAELQERFHKRIILSFPPQLAFGTGAHPTTANCLRLLCDYAKLARRENREWDFFDLGAGSGILAVAAKKLGARKVVALEIDEMALKFCRENRDFHGIDEEDITMQSDDAIAAARDLSFGRFDLIAANLFANLLHELFPHLPGCLKENGQLILSGFLTSQAKDIVRGSEEIGLPLQSFLRRGKWVAASTLVSPEKRRKASLDPLG